MSEYEASGYCASGYCAPGYGASGYCAGYGAILRVGILRVGIRGFAIRCAGVAAAGVHRVALPEPVPARRHRPGRDVHVGPVRAGEPGPVRGDLLLVDLGQAGADHAELHPLAQGGEVVGIQLQLDHVRREQRPARRDHEHVGHVPHGDPQHVLPVTPWPGCHPHQPRMIPGDAEGPQPGHAGHAEDREHQQDQDGGDERPGEDVQHHPGGHDAAGNRPAFPASLPQRSARRAAHGFPIRCHRAPSMTDRMRAGTPVRQRNTRYFQTSGICPAATRLRRPGPDPDVFY